MPIVSSETISNPVCWEPSATRIVDLDFETYFDSKEYTLKKMSMAEYIRDPRFKVHGVGIGRADGVTMWVTGSEVPTALAAIDWSSSFLRAQNVKFDGAILNWIYGIRPKAYVDTLSMARAVLGHRLPSHSLKRVAEHFGLPPKGEMRTDGIRDLSPDQESELAEYCVHDVRLCAEIYRLLLPDFPASQFSVVDWSVRCFVEPRLALDAPILERLYAQEKARRENIFEAIGIPKSVFSSNKKFPDLLRSRGFEVPMKISPTSLKNGGLPKEIPALAVGDAAFMEMRDSRNEELASLCEARIAAKSTLLETRSDKFLRLAKQGAFPFDINFSGAKQTHRFSGGNGAGGNPQNLPKKSALREAVAAPTGHKLIVADYAAIELRIQAWLSMDPRLVAALSNGGDPYCDFASRYFGKTVTKADAEERKFGKTCVLGLGYQMGAEKFKYRAKVETGRRLTDGESYDVIELYRSYYYGLPAYWNTLQRVIVRMATGEEFSIPNAPFLRVKDGSIILPSGLRLQYPNLRVEDGPRYQEWVYDTYQSKHKDMGKGKLYGGKMLENICQALAGELKKMAIARAEDRGLTVVGEVHDEILVVSPTEDAEKYADILRRCMEMPPDWWPQIRLLAEVGIGDNWKAAKA